MATPHRPLPPGQATFPVSFTPFVGREDELWTLVERLTDRACRLLTLVGPGGMGKTRLSLQVSQGGLAFNDGIWFVPLAPLQSAEALAPAIASRLALPAREQVTPRDTLLAHLRDKQLLLILDNFEHLLDGVPLLLEILTEAPAVKLLITSREPLNVQAEWLLRLDGLACPNEQEALSQAWLSYSAVQLFMQRAAQADLSRSAPPLEEVVRLCHLVQGSPLALELAAVQVRDRPVGEIVRLVEQSLDSLVSPFQDSPLRHRSLRAVFEGSWQSLPADEQQALAALSLFRGPFTRPAAEAITGQHPPLPALESKSLLHPVGHERYELHDLVRQFAAEQLAILEAAQGASGQAAARHGSYYLAWLGQGRPPLPPVGEGEGIFDWQAEVGNLREAWQWGTTHARWDLLTQGAAGLVRAYTLAGRTHEGAILLESAIRALRAVEQPLTQHAQAASLLLSEVAGLWNALSRYAQAIECAREAVAHSAAQPSAAAVRAYLHWGSALWYQGELVSARPLLEHAYHLASAMAESRLQADSLRALGSVALRLGDHAGAQRAYEQALRLHRHLGSVQGESEALRSLGTVARNLAQHDAARDYLLQALHLSRQRGDQRGASGALKTLGDLDLEQLWLLRARAHYEQALALYRAQEDQRGQSIVLNNLGTVARNLGEYAEAQSLYQAALALAQAIGFQRGAAWTLACWGMVHHYQGNHGAALQQHEEALERFEALGDLIGQGFVWIHLGHIHAATESWAAAGRAYRLAATLRQELVQPHLEMEAVAGQAQVAWATSQFEEAKSYLERLGHFLAGRALDGTEEPFRLYLTCYQVMAALGDARAPLLLQAARSLLDARAAALTPEALRRSFLAVPIHRALLALP